MCRWVCMRSGQNAEENPESERERAQEFYVVCDCACDKKRKVSVVKKRKRSEYTEREKNPIHANTKVHANIQYSRSTEQNKR